MNDVNIELLQNMLTSLLIRDDLYIFLQCLYAIQHQKQIHALSELFGEEMKVKNLDSSQIRHFVNN